MARTILLVEKSITMRKIISGMILADIDDARIIEADSVGAAEKQLAQNECHLVLFSWDSTESEWQNFFEKAKGGKEGYDIPFVLLTSKGQEKYIQPPIESVIAEYMFIPCEAKEMTELVNRVCNPIEMRVAARYSVANTSVLLTQGSKTWDGRLVNVSSGGMLCDVEYVEDLKWASPFMISLVFHDNNEIAIKGLYSLMNRLRVNETHPDFTPKQIRCAFRFLTVPEGCESTLESIFRQEEERKMHISR